MYVLVLVEIARLTRRIQHVLHAICPWATPIQLPAGLRIPKCRQGFLFTPPPLLPSSKHFFDRNPAITQTETFPRNHRRSKSIEQNGRLQAIPPLVSREPSPR